MTTDVLAGMLAGTEITPQTQEAVNQIITEMGLTGSTDAILAYEIKTWVSLNREHPSQALKILFGEEQAEILRTQPDATFAIRRENLYSPKYLFEVKGRAPAERAPEEEQYEQLTARQRERSAEIAQAQEQRQEPKPATQPTQDAYQSREALMQQLMQKQLHRYPASFPQEESDERKVLVVYYADEFAYYKLTPKEVYNIQVQLNQLVWNNPQITPQEIDSYFEERKFKIIPVQRLDKLVDKYSTTYAGSAGVSIREEMGTDELTAIYVAYIKCQRLEKTKLNYATLAQLQKHVVAVANKGGNVGANINKYFELRKQRGM